MTEGAVEQRGLRSRQVLQVSGGEGGCTGRNARTPDTRLLVRQDQHGGTSRPFGQVHRMSDGSLMTSTRVSGRTRALRDRVSCHQEGAGEPTAHASRSRPRIVPLGLGMLIDVCSVPPTFARILSVRRDHQTAPSSSNDMSRGHGALPPILGARNRYPRLKATRERG